MKDGRVSCAICAKAKSKCIRLPGHEACDRCTRLQKQCYNRELIRKKRKSNRNTNAAHLKHLEDKIESITHALIARPDQEIQAPFTEPSYLVTEEPLHGQATTLNQERHHRDAQHIITLDPFEIVSHDPISGTTSSLYGLSPHEIGTIFDRYMTLMASNMPFVLLPPLSTAVSLETSPFLLQAIIAVAHFHDTSVQQSLTKDLIRKINESIFLAGDKTLDLLQSLLVLCTWYNPHLPQTSSHTTLLHLCMALATDLAIDRDPALCEVVHMATAMKNSGIPQPVKTVSDAERRAVLGVFYLASTVFTSYRKTDLPTWKPWLQNCWEVLNQHCSAEGDSVLLHLVNSQRVMLNAMSAPPQLHAIGAFQHELDGPVSSVGECAVQEPVRILLRLQRASANIAVWEPSFSASNLEGTLSCIQAIKDYLDTYTSLPVPSYLTIPFTVFAQFAYVFVVMVRASSMHMDGFNSELLRESIGDFVTIMDEASSRYEAVGKLSVNGARIRNEGFASWAKKTKWAKTFYSMQIRGKEGQCTQDAAVHTDESMHSEKDGFREDFWSESGLDFRPLSPMPF